MLGGYFILPHPVHVRKISTGSTALTARAKIVGDTNADVRSVCGSKHSCLFCITLTELKRGGVQLLCKS